MQLAKYRLPSGGSGVGRVDGDMLIPLQLNSGQYRSLTEILEDENPEQVAEFLTDSGTRPVPLTSVSLLPPLDQQEVWAAGVTYKRSQSARMEESEAAADCYDRVYKAARPELFFKGTPHRVSGPGGPLRIRKDSKWNVPEPELTLVLSSRLTLVGFTIGNDMSSRDIEGENPLYLPQAKVYNQSTGLGPWITLAADMPRGKDLGISLAVRRGGKIVFHGTTDAGELARTYDDLIGWLGRDNSFPQGVYLMTGTGIVPDSDFTLQPKDEVDITIDGIGTLTNPIVQG